MAPLALVLHLALAAGTPDVAVAPSSLPPEAGADRGPRLELTLPPTSGGPRPFRAGEVVSAALGGLAGDALVIGAGYLALQLFANGTIDPSAVNFRRAAYGLGVAALVVPPLTSVLLAKLGGGPHARGGFWKALLLATAGQAAALAAGYFASPHFWVVLPVQALALSLGTSFGLHWGAYPRARAAEATPAAGPEPLDPLPGATALVAVPVCAAR
jgi:hypothetical protein